MHQVLREKVKNDTLQPQCSSEWMHQPTEEKNNNKNTQTYTSFITVFKPAMHGTFGLSQTYIHELRSVFSESMGQNYPFKHHSAKKSYTGTNRVSGIAVNMLGANLKESSSSLAT